MSYQWNWSVFSQETVVGDGSTYAGWMLAGLKMTVTVSLSAWGLALLVGMVLGVMRTVPHKGLRTVATTCVEVLRSRIADMDRFNENVAPRAVKMVGKPYKCK